MLKVFPINLLLQITLAVSPFKFILAVDAFKIAHRLKNTNRAKRATKIKEMTIHPLFLALISSLTQSIHCSFKSPFLMQRKHEVKDFFVGAACSEQ